MHNHKGLGTSLLCRLHLCQCHDSVTVPIFPLISERDIHCVCTKKSKYKGISGQPFGWLFRTHVTVTNFIVMQSNAVA